MKPYWVSFRIHQDAGYQKRYDALHAALIQFADEGWWLETTSFYIITSDNVSNVVRAVKSCLHAGIDLAIIGSFHTKHLSVVGKCDDQGIFELVDFAKKA